MVTLFTFTVFSILAGHDKAWSSQPTLSFTANMCIQPPKPTQGHETMAATLNFSINHPLIRKEAFAFFKDFFKWCKCMTKFIFKSHLVLSMSSNGQWNDKFPKAVIIHLLRSVKYTFKLLKLTAPQDKTRRKLGGTWANHQPVYFFPAVEDTQT